jgi:hypothetical protein
VELEWKRERATHFNNTKHGRARERERARAREREARERGSFFSVRLDDIFLSSLTSVPVSSERGKAREKGSREEGELLYCSTG